MSEIFWWPDLQRKRDNVPVRDGIGDIFVEGGIGLLQILKSDSPARRTSPYIGCEVRWIKFEIFLEQLIPGT